MEADNIIFKCLGKTLRTEIKYLANVKLICLNENNKPVDKESRESGSLQKRPKVLCLAVDKVIILNQSMENFFDKIPYEVLSHIEIDKKSKDNFSLFIKPNTLMIHSKATKIIINSEFRGDLVKNFLCYHSVYYMTKYTIIRTMPLMREKVEERKEENKESKAFTKLKQRSFKLYQFFFTGSVLSEYNNSYFKIKYDSQQLQSIAESVPKKQEDYLTNECELFVEITDPIPMCRLEVNKDDRDLSFYAAKTFTQYMRNSLKATKYWILKSKTFNKKYNLLADVCQWDGWAIESRISEPFYKNIIFIFLRRKFLPPFFDHYQNFHFVLIENCSKEHYQVNPAAYKLIEQVASSIHTNRSSSPKDCEIFLKAKIDALLVDEETLNYYQFAHGMVGNDVHKFGFEFLNSLISFFEHGVKEKVEDIKTVLVNKYKSYEFDSNLKKYNIL